MELDGAAAWLQQVEPFWRTSDTDLHMPR
eukprot:SAG11_NODE_21117_length_432_cov_0.483483_2_plen_28_part_01